MLPRLAGHLGVHGPDAPQQQASCCALRPPPAFAPGLLIERLEDALAYSTGLP